MYVDLRFFIQTPEQQHICIKQSVKKTVHPTINQLIWTHAAIWDSEVKLRKWKSTMNRKPWYIVVVVWDLEMLTLLTEADMIITTNLESTLSLSSTRHFSFLLAFRDTKAALSLPKLWRTTFHFSPQCQKSLPGLKGHPIPKCPPSHFFLFGSRQSTEKKTAGGITVS